MSTPRRATVAGVALAALALAGCASTDDDTASGLGTSFADQAVRSGLAPNMTPSLAADLYGDDGGALCAVVARDSWPQTLGWARTTVFKSPDEHVSDLVEYDRLVIQTYCPDEENAFDELLDALSYDR